MNFIIHGCFRGFKHKVSSEFRFDLSGNILSQYSTSVIDICQSVSLSKTELSICLANKMFKLFFIVQIHFAFKVVDSCRIFSTKWSDTFRSFLYLERSKNLEKQYVITVQKITFLREFDSKTRFLKYREIKFEKLVFK